MQRLLIIWTAIVFLLGGSGVLDALHRESHHVAAGRMGCAHHESDQHVAPGHSAGHCHHDSHSNESPTGPEHPSCDNDIDCPVCIALGLLLSAPPQANELFAFRALVHVRTDRVSDIAPDPLPLEALAARPPPVA